MGYARYWRRGYNIDLTARGGAPMKRLVVGIAAIGTCALTASSFARDANCLAKALQAYSQLKTAVVTGTPSNPILSPETVVGLRCMEETYCYRVAYCIVGDPKAEVSRQVPYAVEFSGCLQTKLWSNMAAGISRVSF